MRFSCGFLLCLWFLLRFAAPLQAHNQNMTGVRVRVEKTQVSLSVTAHLHDLKSGDPASEIARRLQLRIDGEPFSASKPQLIRDQANGIVIWQGQQSRAHNPNSTPQVELGAAIFPELAGASTVLTVFHGSETVGEAVLDENHPSAVIGEAGAPNGTLSVVWRFARLGVEHIFGGVDHVLFLLTLLLLGGSWRQLLGIVTAFTLAHSITLSLAATQTVSLSPRVVEPIIALSIVAVAALNFRAPRLESAAQKADLRPCLAFGFGLIHGFGFAGALSEIGLPDESLGWALAAFNGGVEVGQAAIALIFAPALAGLVKKWPKLRIPMVQYGSALVALVGSWWFVQRVLVV